MRAFRRVFVLVLALVLPAPVSEMGYTVLRIAFVVLLLLGTARTSWAGLAEAEAAFARGDFSTAHWQYRPLAEAGDPYAQSMLGYFYQFGLGVPKDLDGAYLWYGRAADQGYEPAQIRLLSLTARGHRGAGNQSEAITQLRQIAKGGSLLAQLALGDLFYLGKGVPQNFSDAFNWYMLAARQGDPPSQAQIGRMYYRGEGGPRDYILAYTWLNVAVANTPPGPDRERYREARDQAAALLTSEQLAHAQNLTKVPVPTQQDETASEETTLEMIKRIIREEAELTSRIQRHLASLGYDPGPADGVLGPRTATAIRAFEENHDLPVTGKVSDRLAVQILLALARRQREAGVSTAAEKPKLKKKGTGSGFAISHEGHILTNNHVVHGCREIHLPPDYIVEIEGLDDQSDLALLMAPGQLSEIATFGQGRGIRAGDDVVVAGFPLHGLLASDLNITKGVVSALAGPGDDRRFIQITAPVQQGNSGGPLLDLAGNVVGVVVGKLDAIKVAQATGDIPQNVNFAVSAWTARAFLDAYNVPYETAPSEPKMSASDVAAQARDFTVLVECWK
jgi:S1-C subfamily serine protease